MRPGEMSDSFACFGARCGAHVLGTGDDETVAGALARVRLTLRLWHLRFSRFEPDSELSRLNRDPRHEVPVSPLLARLAGAVRAAGELSGGLVDATLLAPLERAGYDADLGDPLPLEQALRRAPARRPAAPARRPGWQQLEIDFPSLTVSRPPGVAIDSGGLAKGLFADALAETLSGHAGFAIDCAGDLAIGGAAALTRPVNVASPFDGGTLHTFELARGGVATSGIGRRSWLDPDGHPAHHLLDPASGTPAFTGIVQVTALADSALLAEIRAKAALLGGPLAAARWLPDGGVTVLDDGTHRVIEPRPVVTLAQLGGAARRGAAGDRAA